MFKLDNNQNIFLTRGDYLILDLELTNKDTGEPYTPQQGDSIRFAMANDYGAKKADCLIFKNVDLETLQLEILPSDTKKLQFGTYKYDVEFTDAFDHPQTMISALFTVGEEVY